MEETGPEAAKRRRLDSYDTPSSSYLQRSGGNAKPASEIPPHAFTNPTLPPPPAYQRPPLSPYSVDSPAEHRSFPDTQHRSYTHAQPSHSGYSTPLRDPRMLPNEPPYSRNHSVSGVMRSPVDSQPPSQLRPLNTAAANDASHHIPQFHSDSTRTSSSYTPYEVHSNGTAQHGLPMSNPHEPLVGNVQPNAYINSPGTGPQTFSGPFGPASVEIPTYRNSGMQPRKSARATQACDTCRTRKARCDEGKPSCSYCLENNQQCNYKEVPPAKHERAQREILDRLLALEQEFRKDKVDQQKVLEMHNANLENQKGLLETLTDMLARIERNTGAKQENNSVDRELKKSEELDVKPFSTRRDVDSREQKVQSRASSRGFSISSIAPQGTPPAVPDIPPSTVSTTTSETSSDQLNDLQHGTAAHKLLRWPSIKKILDRRNSYVYREAFVAESETRKPTLKPYGPDFGQRQNSESLVGISSPGLSSPGLKFEETGHSPTMASTSPWGSGGFSPPNLSRPDLKDTDHIGGLDADGSLKMDPSTVHRLVNSYMAYIHVMHPILDLKQLRHMIDSFVSQKPPVTPNGWYKAYSPQGSGQKIDPARDLPNSYTWNNGKRRYDSPLGGLRSDPSQSLNQPIERSISNAIVLLVLALGKICEHKGPLPGTAENRSSRTNSSQACSPSNHYDSPHSGPARTSSTASTPGYSASNAQSPLNDARINPLYHRQPIDRYSAAPTYPMSPSNQGTPNTPIASHGRNADKIPGLAYYAYASDILGNEHGGIEVQHVQARLLAGLYMGQLACVIESWQWIHAACVACFFLTRDPSLKRYQKLKDGPAIMDSIRFAYYSCLQLESDILAELDFPSISMEVPEGVVDFPTGVSNGAGGTPHHPPTDDDKVLACYSAQIYLRRSLNAIQRELYPPNHENLGKISPKTQKICEEMLEQWRNLLPPDYRWKDEDEPASEINEARLRAKYYGALYIIHRPFLYHALHNNEYRKASGRMLESDRGSRGGDSHRPNGSMAPPPNYIMQSAEKCIIAAMKSTIAFDGVCNDQHRLITTNIFGTAHAQFGNILVLAATYCTPHLRHLVPKEELIRLIDRTNRFLRMQKNVSDTLEQDARILETVAQTVHGDDVLSNSFSSE